MVEYLLATSLVTGILSFDIEQALYSLWYSPHALLIIAIFVGFLLLVTRNRVS